MLKIVKKYFIKALIVIIIVLILSFLGWNIFFSRWKIKTADDISSVNLFFTLSDGYSDVLITDREQINNILNIVLDMENKAKMYNVVDIKKIEKYQSGPQVALTFNFDDASQSIYIKKNSVVIFDYCIDSNYDDIYFLRLKNIDTDKLLEALYSYIEIDNVENGLK